VIFFTQLSCPIQRQWIQSTSRENLHFQAAPLVCGNDFTCPKEVSYGVDGSILPIITIGILRSYIYFTKYANTVHVGQFKKSCIKKQTNIVICRANISGTRAWTHTFLCKQYHILLTTNMVYVESLMQNY